MPQVPSPLENSHNQLIRLQSYRVLQQLNHPEDPFGPLSYHSSFDSHAHVRLLVRSLQLIEEQAAPDAA